MIKVVTFIDIAPDIPDPDMAISRPGRKHSWNRRSIIELLLRKIFIENSQ